MTAPRISKFVAYKPAIKDRSLIIKNAPKCLYEEKNIKFFNIPSEYHKNQIYYDNSDFITIENIAKNADYNLDSNNYYLIQRYKKSQRFSIVSDTNTNNVFENFDNSNKNFVYNSNDNSNFYKFNFDKTKLFFFVNCNIYDDYDALFYLKAAPSSITEYTNNKNVFGNIENNINIGR